MTEVTSYKSKNFMRLTIKYKSISLPVEYDNLTIPMRKIVREEYKRVQENKCYFCKADLDGLPHEKYRNWRVNSRMFPQGFFNSPQHLHHSHDTGLTLGTVHAHCNAVLWQYFNE